ncbi:MAG: hypothetical protein ABIJ18_00040 [archaeon]
MALSLKEKQRVKRFVRKLEKIRGRHTELVTVYIPQGYDIIKIINHLAQEQGTASNIKDKTTQKHVIDSLEKIIRHLRLFKRTPDLGLAVFAGNVSDKEGRVDIQVYSIEPPVPLNMRLYRCDQTFVLDALREMMDTKEMYGLIVMDRREADIGLLKGNQILSVHSMHSAVPGKTRAGGQCLDPETIVNLADGQTIPIDDIEVGDEVESFDFKQKKCIPSKVLDRWEVKKDKVYKITVEEEIIASGDHLFFMVDETTKAAEELQVGMIVLNCNGQGIVITKIDVVEKEVMLIDIKVENENFIADGVVVHNSAQRFARIREEAAKEFYNRINEAAQKEFLGRKELKGILVGGSGPSKNDFLERGYLNEELKRKVIVVQDIAYGGDFGLKELVEKSKDNLAKESITEEKEVMQNFLKLLATEPDKVAYGEQEVNKALDYGAVEILLVSETLEEAKLDEYEDKADETGVDLRVISTDTTEGEQLRDLGKVAAILRFALS